MGARQITAALDMVGVTTTTERCNGAEELLEALRIHFTASDSPAPCVYTNGKHVRVAVGVVVVASSSSHRSRRGVELSRPARDARASHRAAASRRRDDATPWRTNRTPRR